MSLSRRTLFGRGAGLAAAGAFAPEMLTQTANMAKLGGGSAGYAYASKGLANCATGIEGQQIAPMLFTSFAEWWKQHGEKHAREHAKYIGGLDPDIQGFRLPLQTKYLMQQERNLERLKNDRRKEFMRALKHHSGFSWWPSEDDA